MSRTSGPCPDPDPQTVTRGGNGARPPGPGRGGFVFGGVTGIFLRHLRLLGPDPATWTRHPPG